MQDKPEQDNGHGKKPALIDKTTRHARLPHPNPPPEGEGANESLREFQSDDLFRQLLGDVTPLKPDDRRTPSPAPRKPRPQNRLPETELADTLSDHGAGDVAPVEYLSNGLNRMTLRKLRRGEWPVQDELDLHGSNSDEARRLLTVFLHQATQHELRCVQVIHGKGWHSEQKQGLLKRLARHWLIQHSLVLAFCDAPMNAGGSGAVRVLLKTAGRENGNVSSPPA